MSGRSCFAVWNHFFPPGPSKHFNLAAVAGRGCKGLENIDTGGCAVRARAPEATGAALACAFSGCAELLLLAVGFALANGLTDILLADVALPNGFVLRGGADEGAVPVHAEPRRMSFHIAPKALTDSPPWLLF